MKEPRFKVRDSAASELGISEGDIEKQIRDAIELAEDIATDDVDRPNGVVSIKKKTKKAWAEDSLIGTFFGRNAPGGADAPDQTSNQASAPSAV